MYNVFHVCCLVLVDKVESKEDGTITGKRFLVFDYTGKKIIMIDALKKKS